MRSLVSTSVLIFLATASEASAQPPAPIVMDNTDPGFATPSGEWLTGSGAAGKYGADYRFADNTGNPSGAPTHVASWTVPITETGFYDVAIQYPQGVNRAPDAPFTVSTDYGNHTVRVDQRANGGQFNSLGTFHWDSGQNAVVSLGNNASPNVVLADAVRLTRITTETARNEYRFFWVSRFQWPSSNQATAQANINNVFQTAADNNFNAVFFQIRGQMDTLYPSPLEPWTNTFGWTNPGWNPLQYAINAAHGRGIELHAYFNTHTLASPVPPANTTPQHQYNLHGPGSPAGAVRWDAHDIFGNPIGATDGAYVWLSPGVPEASLHTREALKHLVMNYDVDGVHFDRIRTSQHDASYDPVSVARFEGDGNPDDLTYPEFMKDQITRDLRKIYGMVNSLKPDVVLSAAPIGISERNSDTRYQGTGSAAQYNYNQDGWAWLQAKVLDFQVPQIYWEINSNHPHEKLLADWIANAGERWVVPGSRTDKTIASQGPKPLAGLLGEWQTSVDQGAAGKCYWQWQSLGNQPPGEFQTYYEALKAGPYKNKVSPPAMPWKTNPTTGFIIGVVSGPGGPVVDARVKLDGDNYTYLTGADGFFTILDVEPGTTHALTVTKYGAGSARVENIAVTAGNDTLQMISLQPNRGFVEFFRTRYYHEDEVTVSLYDAQLAASPLATVQVHSPIDPAGETIALAAEGGGKFRGTFNLRTTPNLPGDQNLRAMPGSNITVQYLDSNTGGGASNLFVSEAKVLVPADVIMESRTPGGSRTAAPLYTETGTWSNTGTVGPNNIVIKSTAPGLTGLGGRTSTEATAAYEFLFDVPVSGHYDVYITIPGPDRSSSYFSRGANITVQGMNGNTMTAANLSSDFAPVAGNWHVVTLDKPFSPGTTSKIRVQNTNFDAGPTQQFGADAVKLVFRRPLGVNSDVENWQRF